MEQYKRKAARVRERETMVAFMMVSVTHFIYANDLILLIKINLLFPASMVANNH